MTNWLRTTPIAHRGLHDAAKGVVENSASAFEAAAAGGYAIELDVHPAADGEVIVFHDDTLDRMTGRTGRIKDLPSSELRRIALKGTGDTIPTFRDLLKQIAGRVPLLVEIKSHSREVGPCEARVAELLADYKGEVAVQSFNPYSMGWFVQNAPAFKRGQLSCDYFKETEGRMNFMAKVMLTNMLLNYVSRPHFAGFEHHALPAFGPARMRARGLPVLAWTLRDPKDLPRILPHVDNIIFENFRPEDYGVPHVKAA